MYLKVSTLIVVVLVLALHAGCNRPGKLHAVFILDLTASTLPEARAKAFAGIKAPFDKGVFRRGDSVTVIPITGDALTESQGSVLRFDLPANREVYDDDLRQLSEEVVEQLHAMQRKAEDSPYAYSDITGAVRIASEEFSADPPGRRKILIILSDGIHDVKHLSFRSAAIVANKNAAIEGAEKMAVNAGHAFGGARVYLGVLRSTDLKNMSQQRREGVETFWTEYFKRVGAKSIQVCSDGPGQLAKFIAD